MTIKERLNNFINNFRQNINPSTHTDETTERPGMAYCDPLVLWMHDNYLNRVSKRLVMLSDAIANALTIRWAKTATAKTFKFYDSHEPNGVEIMQEYRQWWIAMGMDELLRAAIPHLEMDGYVLLEPYFNEDMSFDYNVYGSYECSPAYWERDWENEILFYKVQYIPMPEPMTIISGLHNVKSIQKTYRAGEIIHATRGDWNYGLGRSRVLPVWDAITKLRYGSNADFFRRDIRFITAIPEGWKKGKTDEFMRSLNDFLRSTRRAFVYRMEQSKTPDQTPLELPRFGLQSLASPAPQPFSQSEAGGQLLRDPEWARILSGTGQTENFFLGNQAGAVTGSEVDLTRDFYTECEEFALIEPLIKSIINFFANLGIIPPPPPNYVIKYWKDWEHIELAAQMAEAEMEMEQEQHEETERQNVEFDVDKPGRWITKKGKHIYIPIKERELIVDYQEDEEGPTYIASLYGNPKDETLYASIVDIYGERETIELATHVDQMIKIKKWLEHRIEAILGTPEQVKEYEDELFQIQIANSLLGKLIRKNANITAPYVLINQKTNEVISGYRENMNRPLKALMSSTVKGAGVFDSDFLVQFHGSQGTYRYHFDNPEEAEQAYMEISTSSPGHYIWEKFRGWPNYQMGPAYFSGKPTPGGTSASLVDYDIAGRSPIGFQEGTYEAYSHEAETMKKFKMEGDKSTIGAGTTAEPLGFKFKEKGKEKAKPVSEWSTAAAGETPGIVYNPTLHEYPRHETPGIVYNPTIHNKKSVFNSASKVMRLAKDKFDWGMSKRTVYKIIDLVNEAKKEERKNVIRTNSLAYGNGIKADYPLYYKMDNGTISEEYICIDSWKKNIGKAVPLGIYHNLDENIPDLPEWQIIGTYILNGWDEDNGKDIAILDYDENKIKAIFERLNEEDWITPILKAGKFPDVSTAYTCDVLYDKERKRNIQANIELKSVSFVPTGNCPGKICKFTPEEVSI